MKAIRFLAAIILACSMLFVSCKKDKQFTITVNTNDPSMGTVTGSGIYAENAIVTICGNPKTGFNFVQWNDGNKTNPRSIVVSGDATYTAYFADTTTYYTITANSNNTSWGTVTGGGQYAKNSTATLTAIPNSGYHFVKWNDGKTYNPRTITVTGNATYTAIFEADGTVHNYTITAQSNNNSWGYVTGGGTYVEGSTAVLTAIPYNGYHFDHWNDGTTANPHYVTVTGNATHTATFAADAPSTNYVSVTFGSQTWQAATYIGQYLSAYNLFRVMSFSDAGDAQGNHSLPVADVYSYQFSGSATDTWNTTSQQWTNQVFAYLEYYETHVLTDDNNNQCGDWWGKQASINVSAFDATALTLSASINATMFSAYDAFVNNVGADNAQTSIMSITMNNITLTPSSTSKKISKNNKFNGRLFVK